MTKARQKTAFCMTLEMRFQKKKNYRNKQQQQKNR